ncbi:BMP family ABC transporter substrate-binding protein [Streptococcus sp. X16XC17]|uniref:BMP family lipoprotein n=1 Tax=unclassified Streptococcus TaxID=2608887 RepID=UPI00066FFAC7|nr:MULTISPECIES: BMP family protein [unclassified Streptococcus]TCD46411.1 BMP family ABC transporter substrate-binding protein [Streptococcus sp. X16XC17]
MNKKFVGLGLASVAVLALAACGNNSSSKSSEGSGKDSAVKFAMVTDTGGVDDKSFNQSAWEGISAWGEEKGLTEKTDYAYFQSDDESQYETNLESAASSGFNLIAGIGYKLTEGITTAAGRHADLNYVLVDSRLPEGDNVLSALFADHEGAYLAGIVAAKTSDSKKVGFVGGMESDVITRFETGFVEGVKSVDPSIQVEVQYADSYSDAAKGKSIAATMYASGIDVIYHASGATGTGVFQEAADINSQLPADSEDKVWVIGVDRDQTDEGKYTSKDGKEATSTLTSTIKQVGHVLQGIANDQLEGKEFPGGQVLTYGLKDGGVDLVMDGLSEDVLKAVEEAKAKIIDGSLTVDSGVESDKTAK